MNIEILISDVWDGFVKWLTYQSQYISLFVAGMGAGRAVDGIMDSLARSKVEGALDASDQD